MRQNRHKFYLNALTKIYLDITIVGFNAMFNNQDKNLK